MLLLLCVVEGALSNPSPLETLHPARRLHTRHFVLLAQFLLLLCGWGPQETSEQRHRNGSNSRNSHNQSNPNLTLAGELNKRQRFFDNGFF